MLLLAWGSIQSLITYGVSRDALLVLLFALPLAVTCFWAAAKWANLHIGE